MTIRIEGHRSLQSFVRQTLEEAEALHSLYVSTLPDAQSKETENKNWVCFYAEYIAKSLRPLCSALQTYKPEEQLAKEEKLLEVHVHADLQIPSNTYLPTLAE